MEIVLAGLTVLIDEDDLERVSSIRWRVNHKGIEKHNLAYFQGNIHMNGKYTTIRLHRYIMGCATGDGKIVDHINGNTLDNRKQNLRICTVSENSMNKKVRCDSVSGIKGVAFRHNKWLATIVAEGKPLHLGYFMTKEEAIEAYAEASKKYHKEFGRTQ